MKLEEKGQLIIMLVLVMTIGLAIGLSIIQKSLTDVSTATKVEQSTRAYSAAEAGIEKALIGGINESNGLIFTGGNDSQSQVADTGLSPSPQEGSGRQSPIEFPALGKEDLAQVWLASYFLSTNPPSAYYKGTSIDIFWGTPNADPPAALELTIISYTTKYESTKIYLDNDSANRTDLNKFTPVVCSNTSSPSGSSTLYQCYKNITLPANSILLRARLLYNTTSQPFAVQATKTDCADANRKDCSLPPQARSVVSTGTSGDTQRKVRFFQMNKVVPQYFDYAIFSAGDISK